jgi:predicted PurR-regulated permease PerM
MNATEPPPVLPITDVPPDAAAQELRLVSALLVIGGMGLFLALPFVLQAGSVVFLPFFAAAILSIVLSPLADRLAALGLPNFLASLTALLLFIAVAIVVVIVILFPALDLFDNLPALFAKVARELSQLRGNFTWINEVSGQISQVTGHTNAREVVIAQPTVIEQVAVATPAVVIEVLFTLLMTFFMVESRMRMRRRLMLDRVSFGASLKAARVVRQVQDRVGGYILTVAMINFGVGLLVAGAAWWFGFEAPVMWGGIAFVLNFLPYVGPLAMTAVLGLFGLGTADGLLHGLAPALCYLGLHAIEANFVTPAILGARFTINPVLILLSITYFSWIWGVIGALLSVPILLTLTALIEHLGKPNVVGFLFGEPLFPEPPDEDEAVAAG